MYSRIKRATIVRALVLMQSVCTGTTFSHVFRAAAIPPSANRFSVLFHHISECLYDVAETAYESTYQIHSPQRTLHVASLPSCVLLLVEGPKVQSKSQSTDLCASTVCHDTSFNVLASDDTSSKLCRTLKPMAMRLSRFPSPSI